MPLQKRCFGSKDDLGLYRVGRQVDMFKTLKGKPLLKNGAKDWNWGGRLIPVQRAFGTSLWFRAVCGRARSQFDPSLLTMESDP